MLRLLTCFMIGCSILFSCSPDSSVCGSDDAAGEAQGSQTAQLTIVFGTQQLDPFSRSQTTEKGNSSDSTITGTPEESKVSTALVVLSSLVNGASTPTRVHSVHHLTDLKMSGNYSQWTGTIQVKPGSYRITIIANPLPGMDQLQLMQPGTEWEDFCKQVISTRSYQELTNFWRDNAFLMTNAYRGTVTEHDVHLQAGTHTTKHIEVQRLCVRFDCEPLTAEHFELPLKHNQRETDKIVQAQIRLTHAAPMNLSRNCYLLQIISADEEGYAITPHEYENGRNYVADTDWKEKRAAYNNTQSPDAQIASCFYFSSEAIQSPTDNVLHYAPLPPYGTTQTRRLFYASENTIPGIQQQINKISTAVVFKGHITLPGIDAPDVFTHEFSPTEQVLYTSLDHLRKDFPSLTAQPDDAELARHGIRHFKRGSDGTYPVWYTYWNRHNDNEKPFKMGIMEFAVVRNNLYILTIKSIHSIGYPTEPVNPVNPWRPDGNTPDEEWPQLDIQFKVSPWTDRWFDYEI